MFEITIKAIVIQYWRAKYIFVCVGIIISLAIIIERTHPNSE